MAKVSFFLFFFKIRDITLNEVLDKTGLDEGLIWVFVPKSNLGGCFKFPAFAKFKNLSRKLIKRPTCKNLMLTEQYFLSETRTPYLREVGQTLRKNHCFDGRQFKMRWGEPTNSNNLYHLLLSNLVQPCILQKLWRRFVVSSNLLFSLILLWCLLISLLHEFLPLICWRYSPVQFLNLHVLSA